MEGRKLYEWRKMRVSEKWKKGGEWEKKRRK